VQVTPGKRGHYFGWLLRWWNNHVAVDKVESRIKVSVDQAAMQSGVLRTNAEEIFSFLQGVLHTKDFVGTSGLDVLNLMFDEMLAMASRAAKDPKAWEKHKAGADRNLKNFQKCMESRFDNLCDQMDVKYEAASKHMPTKPKEASESSSFMENSILSVSYFAGQHFHSGLNMTGSLNWCCSTSSKWSSRNPKGQAELPPKHR
jgi:hypothetical protein